MTLKILGSRNFIGPRKEALGIATGNELLRNKFSYHVCIYGKTLIKRAHRYLGESRLNKIWTLCPPDRFDHDQMQNSNDIPSTNGAASASAPKRKPPKLRPPKLRKISNSDSGTGEFKEQRVNGIADSIQSNSSSTNSSGFSADSRQNDRQYPLPQPEIQADEYQKGTRHGRRPRRPSTQLENTYQDESIESEDRDNTNSEQRTLQERRVSHMLHPPEARTQMQGSSDLVPRTAAGNVAQVSEVTEVEHQSANNNQLKLRLDLNLDLEIELKAKIRGDLTLQLLQ
ncbi:hypothetical protein PENSTE_c017G01889 [Penicillium steckii]|uniref:Uncharacterized protein n=1 Tax=Penicillium steckii TaxID=303698 RepID=A0A1V6SXB2_9EURO|nr:hypothetical protein PENSTE_c017G01889 [Penicillium steckii]